MLKLKYGKSFLFSLANVLQVFPWGSVNAIHLRHRLRERELLRWAAKAEGAVCREWGTHLCECKD